MTASGLSLRAVAAADRPFQEFFDAVVPRHPFLAVGLALFGELSVFFLAGFSFAADGYDAQAEGTLEVLFRAGHSEIRLSFCLGALLSHGFQILDNLAKLVLDRPESLLVILDDGA